MLCYYKNIVFNCPLEGSIFYFISRIQYSSLSVFFNLNFAGYK